MTDTSLHLGELRIPQSFWPLISPQGDGNRYGIRAAMDLRIDVLALNFPARGRKLLGHLLPSPPRGGVLALNFPARGRKRFRNELEALESIVLALNFPARGRKHVYYVSARRPACVLALNFPARGRKPRLLPSSSFFCLEQVLALNFPARGRKQPD